MPAKACMLLCAAFWVGSSNVYAQQGESGSYDLTWSMSDRVGLRFDRENGTIEQYNSRLDTRPFYDAECHASISDAGGNLLFYLEARRPPDLPSTLRNAFFQVMAGGMEIEAMGSIANGAIVLPRAGSGQVYDLFTLCTSRGSLADERVMLYRHTIDLSDGIGRVTDVNRLIMDEPLVHKLAAVRHANGKDWWLVAHGNLTPEFYVFRIDANGSQKLQRQPIGREHVGHNARFGEICFSPQGDKVGLVTGNGIVEVLRFDRCTGRLSEPVYLGVDNPPMSLPKGDFVAHYGCSFSPSGRYFYYSTIDRLFQVDLSASQPAKSKVLVWEDPVIFANTLAQHELGPDGRIYISRYNHRYLSAIQNPDLKGKACRFDPDALDLEGKNIKAGLPNFPNYRLSNWVRADAGADTTVCTGNKMTLGTPAVAGMAYEWKPADGLSDPKAAQPVLSPQISRTYTLTVVPKSGGSDCVSQPATAEVRLTVLPDDALACRKSMAAPPASLNSLTLYPNPATDFVHLFYDFRNVESISIEVQNSAGELQYQTQVKDSRGRVDFDTTDWPAGVYICMFRRGGQLFSATKLMLF